ncbi:MAG: DNA gyrase subunit A [Victivallales bacterium]|nr:DNA gyrase subunit A [Victivallales bacterium]
MADSKTISPEQWAAFHRNDVHTDVDGLMQNAYLQYSVSANVGRAIPDVRDGLKPGARRILYAMLRGGYTSDKPTSKCAKVVGLVIGNYHPHGDTAVYDTIVRMAQDFSMRLPLIYGHGNFGSMDGDGAAAYRYTECRMEKSGEALLADLDMETVDMRDTFDAKEQEPVVLPAAFPNLLVNGSQGIGVGMATNIPPHNLGETIDACIALIDNPDISIEDLMVIIPGPDYPTGGIIWGTRGVRQLYTTGQGGVRLRSKTEVVTDKNGRDKIVVTEVPYGVNKADMVAKIGEMAQSGNIPGIANVNDYSSARVGVRIEITLKQDATPNVVLNALFRNTQLEIVDPAQFLVVDHNRPRTMNLKQILEAYIDHREQVITRRTQYQLRKAEERDHIVQGLLTAQANIDEVIAIIRSSADRDAARQALISRFGLDELQANAILDMRLAQLTHLALDDLTNEHNSLLEKIAEYKRILSSRENIMEVVRRELVAVKEKFNTPRRTLIEPAEGELDLDGLTKREMYVVTLSRGGYIKRCGVEEYKQQNKGGSGVIGMKAKREGDTVQSVLTTRSHNAILFFTNKGRVYRLSRAYLLSEGDKSGTGRYVTNYLPLIKDEQKPENNEEIRAMVPIDEQDPNLASQFIFMVTRNGIVKRMKLELFKHIPKAGKRALTFREESDDLIDAQITTGDQDILLSSENGRAIRFRESVVRDMGVTAAGVRGIRLKPNADGTPGKVVAMAVAQPEDDLLVITAGGMGKRTPIGASDNAPQAEVPAADDDNAPETDLPEEPEEAEEIIDDNATTEPREVKDHYRLVNRGSQGVISIKLNEGDRVVAALQVEADTKKDILMLSVQGQAVRIPVAQVRRTGRNCKGVIVMRFSKKGDSIANVSIMDELSEEDAAANAAKAAADEESAERAAAFNEQQAAEKAALDERIQQEQASEEEDVPSLDDIKTETPNNTDSDTPPVE